METTASAKRTSAVLLECGCKENRRGGYIDDSNNSRAGSALTPRGLLINRAIAVDFGDYRVINIYARATAEPKRSFFSNSNGGH